MRAIRGLPPLGPERGGDHLVSEGKSTLLQKEDEHIDKHDYDSAAPRLQKTKVSKKNSKSVEIP